MWPLLVAGGVWLFLEGVRGARLEEHHYRMRELGHDNGSNRIPELDYVPADLSQLVEPEVELTPRRRR